MTIWVDAQISPGIARWFREEFSIEARAVRELGLRDSADPQLFAAIRTQAGVVVTKEASLIELVKQLGPPPQILLLTCENTSEKALREILADHFATAKALLDSGEPIVEIS